MAHVNKHGYVVSCSKAGKPTNSQNTERNFYLVKAIGNASTGVGLGNVYFPAHMFGKRVRFKIEVIE